MPFQFTFVSVVPCTLPIDTPRLGGGFNSPS